MAVVLSVLTILAAIIPMLVKVLANYREGVQNATDALVQRDLDVLRAPPTDGGRVQPAEPPKTI